MVLLFKEAETQEHVHIDTHTHRLVHTHMPTHTHTHHCMTHKTKASIQSWAQYSKFKALVGVGSYRILYFSTDHTHTHSEDGVGLIII